MKRLPFCPMVVAVLILAGTYPVEAASSDAAELAKYLADTAGISRGICCIVGNADTELPLAMVRASEMLVHVLDPRDAVVAAARKSAEEEGYTIRRIVIERMALGPLPYADNLIDVLILWNPSQDTLRTLPVAEALRALRPKGKALVGGSVSQADLRQWAEGSKAQVKEDASEMWIEIEKPPLAGVDNWSHWEHGPDNNPVSTDDAIKAPYVTQWMAQPYYVAMPAITTAAGGRTFTAMGHIAHHEREESWLNTILARNGYNGMELWRRRVPDGYLVHRSAFIATEDTFFMIDPEDGCLLLDPETGKELDRVRIPEVRGEWKWIALQDRTLFALAGEKKDPDETTIVRSTYPAWSWGELSKGYYEEPHVPWGFGETIAAYDLDHKKLLWTHSESSPIDSRAMALGEGKVFFYCPKARLGCLDAKSGKEAWTNEDSAVRKLIEEEGHGLSSTPGFRTTCYCVYTPRGLVFAAQTQENVVAVSKDDGHVLWHRRKTTSNPNAVYLDDRVLVGIGPDGSTLALDPTTGDTIEDLGFKKRSCARLTATPDSLFCRGYPEGITRYDRRTKSITFDGSVRPACNDGVMAAQGLLYIGPWLCDCNLSLMGTVALCSGPASPPLPSENALEVVVDEAATVEPLVVSEKDWSTYRGNNAHAGSSTASVASPLQPLWTWEPSQSYLPTAPVAAGGLAFVAGDDGVVRAIDAPSGKLRWTFSTAGPILRPPTIWEGRAYVGSGDGYVYALEAATGRLLWRFHAAPVERRIPLYGALCSTWPVNTGVLVDNGVAYCAAGVIDYDGTYVYALDARTGATKWRNTSSGHLDKTLRKGVSAQGGLTLWNAALWMAGGNVISPASYQVETGDYVGDLPRDGSPQSNRGEEIGVFRDRHLILGGRLQYSASENVVNPEVFWIMQGKDRFMGLSAGHTMPVWDDDLVVATPSREDPPVSYAGDAVGEAALASLAKKSGKPSLPPPLWKTTRLAKGQTVALALARDSVVAACRMPRERDLRPRWLVSLLKREDGAFLCDADLPGPARENGLAIDRDGRVLVALADGSLAGYGGSSVFQSYLVSLVGMADTDADRQQGIARIQAMLDSVHDREGRAFLIASLQKLGVDVFGPGRKAGCLMTWHVLGPVPWDTEKNPLDKTFVKEPKVKLDRTYRIGERDLDWQEYTTVHPTGMVDLAGIHGPNQNVAAYAYAEFESSKAEDVVLQIGSNDGFKCWFNGDVVGRHDGGRRYEPDQDALKVRTKQGTNRILIKVTQEGGGWALGVRVTDADGSPIEVTPEAS